MQASTMKLRPVAIVFFLAAVGFLVVAPLYSAPLFGVALLLEGIGWVAQFRAKRSKANASPK